MLDLLQEFEKLNERQKEAVKHDNNTVVLAGPGSGKTSTLVIKVAYLFSGILEAPSGMACITFNNDAVREFRNRLIGFGIYAGRRLFLGTVHSFCLNCVLRPYAQLIYSSFCDGIKVAGPKYAELLLDRALSRYIPNTKASYYVPTLTRLRRKKACGEDISGFDDLDPLILEEYERLLAANKMVDFEWMVTLALELITNNGWIRKLLGARFQWLIVDEYQDLGGPLHKIVTTLSIDAGIKVFAVGDPDQTIYDFTGATPHYLTELMQRPDFKSIRLKFNYRSGRRLIDASQAALSPEVIRDYEPDPKRSDTGEVFFLKADDKLADHAVKTVQAVKQVLSKGTRPEGIAIFYQRKTLLLDDLRSELTREGIPHISERESKYPNAPIIRWLQDVAAWSLSYPFEREYLFENIVRHYADLMISAGYIDDAPISLDVRSHLFTSMVSSVSEDMSLREWLHILNKELNLRGILTTSSVHSEDSEAFDELFSLTESGKSLEEHNLTDFASVGRLRGKVVLTTFHSSKGRQFDIVIIPGLVEGVIPPWTWNRRKSQYEQPFKRVLGEARRLFYVGFTRARYAVYLIYSKGYIFKGYDVSLGISRFAIEISKRLKADE